MIIDADAHWMPPTEIFKDCLSDSLAQNYQRNNNAYFSSIQNYKSRLCVLKVDKQLLNFYGDTVGLQYSSHAGRAVKMATAYNHALDKLCQENKEFDYTAWLPLQDLNASESLLDNECAGNSFAIHIGEQVPWGFTPKYHRLFSKIAEKNLPVYLHFSGHYDFPLGWDQDLDPQYANYHSKYPTRANAGVGESPTWKITIASLILSGILEKYNLKIILAEQGLEWIPEFCNTMLTVSSTDPIPYFKKFFWFTTEIEEKNFLCISKSLGFDRLLFATDWPHGTSDIGGSNMFKDVDLLNSMLSDNCISQEEYNQITHQNYIHLNDKK